MAWHSQIVIIDIHTFLEKDIALANAANFDLYTHLAGAWLQSVALSQFELCPRGADFLLFFRHGAFDLM